MRLGPCTYQDCGKPSRLKYEQRLCADHLQHFELLAERREGLNEALKVCRAVHRRMPERDRVALGVAIDEIRAKIKEPAR
jgi:hypothetical protein